MLTDTHAHIHHDGLVEQADEVVARAREAGVRVIDVGCTGPDSAAAIDHAERFDLAATVGLHPQEADKLEQQKAQLVELATHPRVVAIGECGLDYYRFPSNQVLKPDSTSDADQNLVSKVKHQQEQAFRLQIELALEHNLPMVWHIREAFPDFFRIIDDYPGVRGVSHCFTSTLSDMNECVSRGFHIALNGIMTFTKLDWQLEMAKAVPLESLVLETDCPFLAPVPFRGRTNEPAYLIHTAEFLANLRGESLEQLAEATTHNAADLFNLN